VRKVHGPEAAPEEASGGQAEEEAVIRREFTKEQEITNG